MPPGFAYPAIIDYSILLYLPDTHPTLSPTTTACQPLAAVATYGRTVPFSAAVIRVYFTSFPARMFTVPILHNEVYCGDRNILKSPARNYLTKKVDPSMKRESHYVQDHHEGIISRELRNIVQERLKLQEASKETGSRPRKDHHPYFDRVICAVCGQPHRRCLWKNRHGETTPMWKCSGRARGECYARNVRENELTSVMNKAVIVRVTEFGLETV